MFKFKMLIKVLVAVFVFGQLIESNLKLCIALSIDLDAPASSITLQKTRPSEVVETITKMNEQLEPDKDGPPSASRASASTGSSTMSSTSPLSPSGGQDSRGDTSLKMQTIESNGRQNYFGKIFVGQQQVPFLVLFDLTSTAFWLPSSECKSVYCISRQKYNKQESGTHKDDGRVANWTYTANVQGAVVSTRLVRDKVTFAGVTIDDQLFGEALEMDGEPFAYMPLDGFLGLGFKDLNADSSSSAAIESPFERMYRAGLLKEPIFSLLVHGDVSEYGYSADNGQLILGQLAEDYEQSDLTYVPVTHVDYWEFHLDSISLRQAVGDLELERGCESACPAILDTGSSYISGHYTDVDRINKAMGAYPVGDGLYRLAHCDLALMPNLIFTIGDTEFSLEPEHYVTVHRILGNIVSCYSNLRVVSADQYPFWILGELFLKRHYIVFDYGQKRLGFAQLKNVAEESEEEIYKRIPRRKKHII